MQHNKQLSATLSDFLMTVVSPGGKKSKGLKKVRYTAKNIAKSIKVHKKRLQLAGTDVVKMI